MKKRSVRLNYVQSSFLSFKQKFINCRHSNQEVSYFIQQKLAIVFWYVIKFAASMLQFLQSTTSQKERQQQYTCRRKMLFRIPAHWVILCLLINFFLIMAHKKPNSTSLNFLLYLLIVCYVYKYKKGHISSLTRQLLK